MDFPIIDHVQPPFYISLESPMLASIIGKSAGINIQQVILQRLLDDFPIKKSSKCVPMIVHIGKYSNGFPNDITGYQQNKYHWNYIIGKIHW